MASDAKQSLKKLIDNDKKVTASDLEDSINEASRRGDYRQLEELMVEAKCEAKSLK